MRISDLSSDVCSSDLVLSGVSALLSVPVAVLIAEVAVRFGRPRTIIAVTVSSVLVCCAIALFREAAFPLLVSPLMLHGCKIGRESRRAQMCKSGSISVAHVYLKKTHTPC